MTTKEREKIDRKYRRRSKAFKWIRRRISHRLGDKLIEWNDSKWSDTFA